MAKEKGGTEGQGLPAVRRMQSRKQALTGSSNKLATALAAIEGSEANVMTGTGKILYLGGEAMEKMNISAMTMQHISDAPNKEKVREDPVGMEYRAHFTASGDHEKS